MTECGNTIYFEMAFTNKKKVKDYLDIWLELRNIVVEIDIKSLMMINKSPTFKALFYNGKCFNTKRNDTYYNTIGKYKEEKLKGEVDVETKKGIKNLDWFWDEAIRYKTGKVDIEYMANLIDCIEGLREKWIIEDILKKSMCTGLYRDYKEYKNLDEKVKYAGVFHPTDSIVKTISSLHEKYNAIDTNYEVKLREKKCTKSKTYFKGSRRHPYASYKVFSHYERSVSIKHNKKIISTVYITNRIAKIFSTEEGVAHYIKNIIDNHVFKYRCISCHKLFIMEKGELMFYSSKGLDLPRRCKSCRDKRRNIKGRHNY